MEPSSYRLLSSLSIACSCGSGRQGITVVSRLTKRTLGEFVAAGVELAYPTTRVIPTTPDHPYQANG